MWPSLGLSSFSSSKSKRRVGSQSSRVDTREAGLGRTWAGLNRTWRSFSAPFSRDAVRSMRGTSYIEGPRPVRSGLPPPPSSRANLDREETRAGFLPSFRGFAGVGRTTRRPGGAERAALSLRVSSLDFRGERSARPARLGLHRTRQTRISISLSSSDSSRCSSCRLPPSQVRPSPAKSGYKRSTRCGSRIEGTRPVRFGLRPPPSSLANLYREETRAGFPYSFRGFAGVGATRDADDVRNEPHFRARSRRSISGGSVCADERAAGARRCSSIRLRPGARGLLS